MYPAVRVHPVYRLQGRCEEKDVHQDREGDRYEKYDHSQRTCTNKWIN